MLNVLRLSLLSRVQDKGLQIDLDGLDAIRQSIFNDDGHRTAQLYPDAMGETRLWGLKQPTP